MQRRYMLILVLAAICRPAVAGESDRPLSEAGLENLVAFARVYGYVRHFHPSDEAAAADWEQLAIDGVRAAEPAETPSELAERLAAQFLAVAPGVRIGAGEAEAIALPAEVLNPPGTPAQYIRYQKHFGFGRDKPTTPNIYKTQRLKRPLQPGERPAEDVDPARNVWRAALPRGLACAVPLTLFGDEGGTLPRGAGSFPQRPAEPDANRFSGDDRSTRLAAVIMAWNILQHYYPYFDVVETDWPAAMRAALQRAATDQDACAFLETLQVLIAALKDGHGGVMHACRADPAVPPLGLYWVGERLIITRIAAETAMSQPAAAAGSEAAESAGDLAGLRAGDEIIAIDGTPTAAAFAKFAARTSSATPQWTRWRAVRQMLDGPRGTRVRLEVESSGGERRTVELERSASPFDVRLNPPRPAAVCELQPGIMYLDFQRASDQEFAAALEQFVAARGIIVDARGYPRSSALLQLAAHTTKRQLLSSRWLVPTPAKPDRVDMTFDESHWPVPAQKPLIRAELVFLTDGRAISAAETNMQIVAHYELGEIVGSATAGTNGNVNPFTLPGGYTVYWTGMKVLNRDGSRHHGVGVRPTIPLEPTRAGIAAGRDELLERALALLTAGEKSPGGAATQPQR